MLLILDVGNTNITIGVCDGDELLASFRLTSKATRTSDEFGVDIYSVLQAKGISPKDIDK